jgi:hypothetical protein
LRWTHWSTKGKHCGKQQQQADHRSHAEVLLADDLLVHVGGEHVILAADHLWHTEVRDDQREHDEGCADQAVTRTRDGNGPESAPGAGLERLGRLVETRVRGCQRRGHDDERVREGPEHLAYDDADRPIDRGAEQSSLGDPLIAEQVDEADGREQRGRQQRDLRHQLEDAASGHAGPGQSVGEDEREQHADHGADQCDQDTVGDRGGERRIGEVLHEVGEPDELALGPFAGLDQQRPERQQYGDDKPEREHGQHHAHQDIVAAGALAHRCGRARYGRRLAGCVDCNARHG